MTHSLFFLFQSKSRWQVWNCLVHPAKAW